MAECNTGTRSRLKLYTNNVRQGDGGWYYDFQMYIYSGDPATYGNVGWSANASGVGNSGSFYCNGSRDYNVWNGTRGPFGWDGNGNTGGAGNSLHMNATGTQGLGGPADCGETVYFPRVGQAPGQVGGVGASSVTPTSATISWATPSRGHADINNYDLHVCDSAAGLGTGTGCVFYNWTGSTATSKALSNLNPGTRYYVQVRAGNSDGQGAWSTTYEFDTLPSTPPTLNSVTPDATGKQATVTMSPPAGISSVNSYTVYNRTPGGAWTPVASGSANPSQTILGLVSGQTYEWKVTATIGTYTSPDSNVIIRTQPQPNTSPGAYFDGDTPDTPSTNYTWKGAAGASISEAQTLTGGAVGWLKGPATTAKGSGGSAVAYQIAGGIEPNGNGGDWSVQYVMLTPATGNGFRAGTDGVDGYAAVTVNGVYMGSVWVESSKARPLAAMWVWYDAAGGEIGTARGATVQVAAGTPIRLSALGTAPALAVRGAVVVTDPPGSLLMDAGDSLILDANMGSTGTLYPYFDGETPDTADYIYEWEGAANTSPSRREDVPGGATDPLQDPFCDPIPHPPTAPAIEDDCIESIGSWRRTWYEVDASNVPAYLAGVPTVILQTFGQPEGQVRIRYYANPECVEPLAFDASSWQYEQIISYIPANSTITIDGVSRRVWAEVPTGSAPIPADSLLYGTDGVPASWPVITCGTCWLVSLDTPLDSTAGNLVVSADLTIRE